MYFVITVNFDREYRYMERERVVGFYDKQIKASTRILENACDIFEDGYYQYAVIQYIEEGLYPNTKVIQWYKYDRITREVKPCRAPKTIKPYNVYVVG